VLARTIYIRCIYGIFGRKITKYTVVYGVYIQFWPTLVMCIVHTFKIRCFLCRDSQIVLCAMKEIDMKAAEFKDEYASRLCEFVAG